MHQWMDIQFTLCARVWACSFSCNPFICVNIHISIYTYIHILCIIYIGTVKKISALFTRTEKVWRNNQTIRIWRPETWQNYHLYFQGKKYVYIHIYVFSMIKMYSGLRVPRRNVTESEEPCAAVEMLSGRRARRPPQQPPPQSSCRPPRGETTYNRETIPPFPPVLLSFHRSIHLHDALRFELSLPFEMSATRCRSGLPAGHSSSNGRPSPLHPPELRVRHLPLSGYR